MQSMWQTLHLFNTVVQQEFRTQICHGYSLIVRSKVSDSTKSEDSHVRSLPVQWWKGLPELHSSPVLKSWEWGWTPVFHPNFLKLESALVLQLINIEIRLEWVLKTIGFLRNWRHWYYPCQVQSIIPYHLSCVFQVSLLIILDESENGVGKPDHMGPCAQAVMKAAEKLIKIGKERANNSPDQVLHNNKK